MKRLYDDACGAALALEFVGERWSPLIMREMMFGPRRFGELKANVPGISANLLTQRLERMESAGLVERRRLPSPANVQVYDLTAWGRESEPIFQEMVRWALRSKRHDPTLFLSPASAMISMRALIATPRDDLALSVVFRFPADSFVARLTPDGMLVERGDSDAADLVFACDPTTLIRLVYGKWPIAAAEEAGLLALAGDRTTAERFIGLFALPKKIA